MRRIAVVTGKRGGYGAMKQMLKCIDSSQSMELSLIVTDQHLSAEFGSTINEVKDEFSVAAEVDMCQAGDTERERVLFSCLLTTFEPFSRQHFSLVFVVCCCW